MSTIADEAGHRGQLRGLRIGSLFGLATAGARALARRHNDSITVEHMESMSDALLKDIGIARCEIPMIVRGVGIDGIRRRHAAD